MLRGGKARDMRGTLMARVTLAVMLALALPLHARAGEPDRRDPPAPPEISALQAAEAEAQPLLPAPHAVEIPILVYHHVVPGHQSPVLYVTPEAFEQQLKYLQSSGYRSVSFADLADCLEYGMPLPERPVIISFDDGWENQFQNAFPLLQKYGFSATFFVVTSYLDHQNFMTVEQLKAMLAAGMVIGGHSRSHPALPSIGNPQRLKDEIAGSKSWLEQQLGVAVDTFAYPYGAYTQATVAAVKAAGYRTARTVDSGTHATLDNLETLPAVIYPEYVNHYRANVEVAASR
jgi:peptidoglycan/xylan/chitin deacetylase (PgdA/CDA1 family)